MERIFTIAVINVSNFFGVMILIHYFSFVLFMEKMLLPLNVDLYEYFQKKIIFLWTVIGLKKN